MTSRTSSYEILIQQLLAEHTVGYQEYPWGSIEDSLIRDALHQQYQVVTQGWKNGQRIHYVKIHLRIAADGKIWIEANNTETPLADALVELGVPRTEIVIGLLPQDMRAQTAYAVL